MVQKPGEQRPVSDLAVDGIGSPVSMPNRGHEETHDLPDEGRSSSLSELEECPDVVDVVSTNSILAGQMDVDSEAETERLDQSPRKNKSNEIEAGSTVFTMSADKLAHTVLPLAADTEVRDDSPIASPDTAAEELRSEPHSAHSATSNLDHKFGADVGNSSARKRKHVESQDIIDKNDAREESIHGSRHVRSVMSDVGEESVTSSREATIEPMEHAPDGQVDVETPNPLHGTRSIPRTKFSRDTRAKIGQVKNRKILKGILEEGDDVGRIEELRANETHSECDAEERAEGEDEDTETMARDEGEYTRKMAAIESLAALERHFAALRDRLYDERIVSLNEELAQLSAPKPSHPGYLRRLECINKYRDEKFDSEQKLLVYKTKSLKTKSVAQRSQVHSAYYQTVRDVREKHLDRIGERLSRLRRDHAKADEEIPAYSIPFATRRSTQVSNQISYNKEVSILAGFAKYAGFPAAPNVACAPSSEVDEDMEKMGIPTNRTKNLRPVQPKLARSTLSVAMSRPAAEEQFLEKNPWANPQHPVHQQHIGRLSRQVSDQTQLGDMASTPASHKGLVESTKLAGSASTIQGQSSTQNSSALGTPYNDIEGIRGHPAEWMASHGHQPQLNTAETFRQQRERLQSISPTETRKHNLTASDDPGPGKADPVGDTVHPTIFNDASNRPFRSFGLNAFGFTGRKDSRSRVELPHAEVDGNSSRHDTSPINLHQHARETNLAPATGLSRVGAR